MGVRFCETVMQPCSIRPFSTTHPRRGSFADLAVVIACVLCILMLVPVAVMHSRESSRQQRREQSLHQIGSAMERYHQTWNAYPTGKGRGLRPSR